MARLAVFTHLLLPVYLALIAYEFPLLAAASPNVDISTENKSNVFMTNSLGVSKLIDLSSGTVAYKDHVVKSCYIEKIGSQSVWETGRVLIIHPKVLTNQQLLTIAGPIVSNYCYGWPPRILRQTSNAEMRSKRSNQHYFIGRKPRGQTQSQYLNYGNAGSTDPGKAEAESTQQGSKAIVYGSSGMGQAQSQSGPFSCADCNGRNGDQSQLLHLGPGFPSYLQTSQVPGQQGSALTPSGTGTGQYAGGPGFITRHDGSTQAQPGVTGTGSQLYGPDGKPLRVDQQYPTISTGLQPGQRIPDGPGGILQPGQQQISDGTGRISGPESVLHPGQQIPGSTGRISGPGGILQPGQQHISDGTGRISGPGGIMQRPGILQPGQQQISDSTGRISGPGSILQSGQQIPSNTGRINGPGGILQPGQHQIPDGTGRISGPGSTMIDSRIVQPGQQQMYDGTGRISGPVGMLQPGQLHSSDGTGRITGPGTIIQGPEILQPGQQIGDGTGRITGPGGILQPGQQQIPGGAGIISTPSGYPGQTITSPGQQIYDQDGIQKPSGRPINPSDIERVTTGGTIPGGSISTAPGQTTYYIPGGSRQRTGSYDDGGIGLSQQAHDGTFSGHLTGQYQSPVGHSGDFSGSFQGRYNPQGGRQNIQYSLPGEDRTSLSQQGTVLGGREQAQTTYPAPGIGGTSIYYQGSAGGQYPTGTQQGTLPSGMQSGTGIAQGPTSHTQQVLYPGISGTTIPTTGQYLPGRHPQLPSSTVTVQQPGQPSGQYPGQQSGQYSGQSNGQYPGYAASQYPVQTPSGQGTQFPGQTYTPGTTYPGYTQLTPGSHQQGYEHRGGVQQQPGIQTPLPSRESYGQSPSGGQTFDSRLYGGAQPQGGSGQQVGRTDTGVPGTYISREGALYGPDGRIISTGGQQGQVVPGVSQTSQAGGDGVVYGPDGRIISAGQQIPGALQTGQTGGDRVMFGPDGRIISTGQQGQYVPGTFQTGQTGGDRVVYGPDGRIISTGGQVTGTLPTGQTDAGRVQYGPDGRIIGTGGQQGQQLPGASAVQYGPDGKIISTGGQQEPGALYVGQRDYATGAGQATGVGDSDSQAQSSIQRVDNETQASASSSGRFASGTAQSQVSGSYSGQGSFSASAGSNDGLRGAQTQVSGNKDGALSSSQGQGGKGQSQAQVQLAADTGDTTSSAQTGGLNHGTNTQVQSGIKGGMSDAQANGPGSTSSQAQIGFTPYDVETESDSDPTNPHKGGGTASASSGTHAGKSQVQINGKYAFGIRYTGQAQASSANSGHTASEINLPTMKPIDFGKHYEKPAKQEKVTNVRQIEDARILRIVTTSTTPLPDDDIKDSDYEDDYDEPEDSYPKNLMQQQQTRSLSHDTLDPLEDISEPNMERSALHLKHGDVIQAGDFIPGSNGYKIPAGFRGRVAEEANFAGANTRRIMFAAGAKTNRHRNSGDVGYGSGYTYHPTYSPIQYGFKSTKTYQPPKFVSVTKSETGSRNVLTGKKTPSVYYTQSSSCGYFTNTCFYSNGKKICMPKPKANPDGTPIVCRN